MLSHNLTLVHHDSSPSHADTEEISKPVKLLKKDWKPIKTGKPSRKIPGIYLIGLRLLGYVIYLYLGRSNDIRRRLYEHMQPSRKSKQKIDEFIQFVGEDYIEVKWIEDPDQKEVEGRYLDYMEEEVGYTLYYNKKAGDGASESVRSKFRASRKPDHMRILKAARCISRRYRIKRICSRRDVKPLHVHGRVRKQSAIYRQSTLAN